MSDVSDDFFLLYFMSPIPSADFHFALDFTPQMAFHVAANPAVVH